VLTGGAGVIPHPDIPGRVRAPPTRHNCNCSVPQVYGAFKCCTRAVLTSSALRSPL